MSKPPWVRDLALRRIKKLFKQAEKEFKTHPERSNRYMELAHKISKKYNVSIPNNLKKRFCPNCNRYWKQGETVKTRINSENHRVIYTCQKCETQRTYGYSKEKTA